MCKKTCQTCYFFQKETEYMNSQCFLKNIDMPASNCPDCDDYMSIEERNDIADGYDDEYEDAVEDGDFDCGKCSICGSPKFPLTDDIILCPVCSKDIIDAAP